MKAVEYKSYGGPEVFQLCERPQPEPKADEVLIRVHATTVTAADIMMRLGEPRIGRLYLGLRKPKRAVLGFEFAGEVVAVGAAVTTLRTGERVFGGTTAMGAYAEYMCVKASDVLATIPDNISEAEAAPVSGSAITALHFLQGLARLTPGQKVLVNGAAGGVGSYAVQIAKLLGAEVTGVCSQRNMACVAALGADHVIDYAQTDFTQAGTLYDVIFDTVSKRDFRSCKPALTAKGIYLPTVVNPGVFMAMIGSSIFGGKRVKTGATGMVAPKQRLAYLLQIRDWMADGKLRSVIDREYGLSEMAEAHAYVAQGHKQGAVIVRVKA